MGMKRRRLNIAQRIIKDAKRMGGDEWQQAAVLLASGVYGPNADRIAKELGIPRAECRGLGRMARANRVWVGRGLRVGDWCNPRHGGVEFCLDLATMSGLLERVEEGGE